MVSSQDELLKELQEIDPYKFEQFIGELWELQSWNTYVTQGADDGGIDVIAEQSTPFPKKQVIQVKRYEPSNSVGRPEIQQYASIRQEQTDVDTVVVVTTGQFTDGAEEAAKKLNVKLIAGPQLYNLIDALNAFQLAQSYIEPEADRGGTTTTNGEDDTSTTPSQDAGTVEDPQSITEFGKNTQLKDVPEYLPSLIKLRGEIVNDLQVLRSNCDSAEEAFHEERYFDAVEEYEEIHRRREKLERKIARYDAGLTHIDSTTIVYLSPIERFATELAQITEGVNNHFREAFQIVERAKGLELLVNEITDRVDEIRNQIESGDQLRRSGKVEKGHSAYRQAKHGLEALREELEIYEGLVSEYDDTIVKSHSDLPEGISLSELESEIASRRDSFEEHLEVPKVADDAMGSFSPEVLTGNNGLFDTDLIEHLEDDEKLEFVFKPPRRGFRIIPSEREEETPYHDALQDGSCFLLITDQRVLYIAGVEDHDEKRSIEYDHLSDVTASVEATSSSLQFTDDTGTTYKFAGLRDHTSDLEPAATYVRSRLE